MSRRAAARLESLGFGGVSSYAPGKADWLAYGWPAERGPGTRLVGDFIAREVPRCRLTDLVRDAKLSSYEVGMDVCVVVNAEDIVLGLCSRQALHAHPAKRIEDVMQPGPMTIRPSMMVEEALKLLDRHKMDSILVTNPDGKLMGCFSRGREETHESEIHGKEKVDGA